MATLNKRQIDLLQLAQKDYFVWDGALPGFGIRVWPSGKKSFVAQYRVGKRTRRLQIGTYGPLTVEEARKLAKAALGDVAKGEDPQADRKTRRNSLTVSQLCDDYLRDADRQLILGKHGKPKRSSTLATDRGRIARHIKPLLGNRLVIDLTPVDVNRFVRDVTLGKTALVEKTERLRGKSIVRGGAGTASRTVGLLGAILNYAVMAGVIPSNPATGIKRPPDKRSKRRLSPQEYSALGRALTQAEEDAEAPQALSAIRILALTGCRRGEVQGLRWSEVDAKSQALRLQDTKEGHSVRPVGKPVIDLLSSIPRTASNDFVFTASRASEGRYGGLPGAWERIAARADLKGVTMHTLRHSYASVAADLGYTETTIAALLGHASRTMTSSYMHHLDSVLVSAADRVAKTVQRMMDGMTFEQARPSS
jgi:integrase